MRTGARANDATFALRDLIPAVRVTTIWRLRIRQRLGAWGGAAIIIALATGLFWDAGNHVEGKGGASPASAVGGAMSKAAGQRLLHPWTPHSSPLRAPRAEG